MLKSTRHEDRTRAAMPPGVQLDRAVHAHLIAQIGAGHSTEATDADRINSLSARNSLITAYLAWITRQATRTSPTAQASEDRAAEATLRCLEALDRFEPSRGVPLYKYLQHSRSTQGEAVARAGMPGDLANRNERRALIRRGLSIPRPSSLDRPIGGGVESLMLSDVVPDGRAGPEELMEEADMKEQIYAALDLLSKEHRALLVDAFGLDGRQPVLLSGLARERGITPGSASRRLARASATLAAAAPHLKFLLEN
ncbi:sigma factor [Cryobacterium sp. 10I1]|uniref:sigma factor n=2 Tax=unclassified Cryobacterium TaxID=2649013 RepID=UPI002B23CBBB|nr:sigma factor [Cryobacterium sp. 10I1]MEB0303872.1 sigma factor [Cryobacterium sp. 10I1]